VIKIWTTGKLYIVATQDKDLRRIRTRLKMSRKETVLKEINELRVPSDMKKMAWDWYKFGYEDALIDSSKN
jgi:hypothetical protein